MLPSKVGASADGPILTIPDLSFDDEGMYECEAYSSEGRDMHQGRVSVQGTLQYSSLNWFGPNVLIATCVTAGNKISCNSSR